MPGRRNREQSKNKALNRFLNWFTNRFQISRSCQRWWALPTTKEEDQRGEEIRGICDNLLWQREFRSPWRRRW